jgi:hypothetical protein
MTWSLVQSYSGAASHTTVMQYLFDTYLPSTEWNVRAHPSGSATKRVLSRAKNCVLFGQSNWTTHYWADFGTSGQILFRDDYTYTTTPGDIGTTTQHSITMNTVPNANGYYFWASSDNSKAQLVTKGKSIIWFDPGVTDIMAYVDNAWNGTTYNNGTILFPYNYGNDHLGYSSYPALAGSYTNVNRLMPTTGQGTGYGSALEDIVFRGFSMGYGDNNSTGVPKSHAYTITANDIALHRSVGYTNTAGTISSGNGVLVLYQGEYWLRNGTDTTKLAFMFNFGATEPSFV